MEIVLLGATGFVGGAVLNRLQSDHTTSCIHALVRGSSARIQGKNKVHPVVGELPKIPRELIPTDTPHVIVHFATAQRAREEAQYSVNREGVREILRLCNKNTLGIVYGSSLSVLGQREQVFVNSDEPYIPATALARSRMETEIALREACQAQGIPWVILRPRFVIGESDPHTLGAWLNLTRKGIWFGNGKQQFSVVSVLDYADIVLRVVSKLFSKNEISGVYGVGYRRGLAFADLWKELRIAQNLSGKPNIRIPAFMSQVFRLLPGTEALAVRCELMSFHHTVNVADLERIIGTDLTNKDPIDVLREMARTVVLATKDVLT